MAVTAVTDRIIRAIKLFVTEPSYRVPVLPHTLTVPHYASCSDGERDTGDKC